MTPPFRTRNDVILYAQARAPSRACRRAFENKVELLGGFEPLHPLGYLPGWLLRVTSIHGRMWLIAVTISAVCPNNPLVDELDCIPWERWTGHTDRIPVTIYDGDNPWDYARRRKEAIDVRTKRTTEGVDTDKRCTEDCGEGNGLPIQPSDNLQLDSEEVAENTGPLPPTDNPSLDT